MIDIPPQVPQPVTHQCIHETAQNYQLPTTLIYAVLAVEGGTVGKMSTNTNGTYDMGPMQINTIWLEHFGDYVSPSDILYNGCINVQVGAWILRSRINEADGHFWKGVGGYHSRTPDKNRLYQEKVYTQAQKLR